MKSSQQVSHRRYICTDCDEYVRVEAFPMGAYPNGFHVACDCISMDACPYEMSQAETPDSWMIERPDCCAGVDVTDLETVYGGGVSDFECSECGAKYRSDGTMSEFPAPGPATDENQEVLPT